MERVEVRIGHCGKGVGRGFLKEARHEWDRIRAWSKENNRDARELKHEKKRLTESGRGLAYLFQLSFIYLSLSTLIFYP